MLVRDVLAYAGDPIHITVPYLASPPPTVTWSRAGEDLKDTDRVGIETDEHFTSLNNKKCVRGDAGTYQVTLTNELGSDSANVSEIHGN